MGNLQLNAHRSLNNVGPGPTSQLSYGHSSVSPENQETEEASAYSGTSRIIHVADRRDSPQRNRSRHTTDSPKDRTEQLYMQGQESTHPTSSMRGVPSTNYHPSPPSHDMPSSYMMPGTSRSQNPQSQTSYAPSSQTYYNDSYQQQTAYPAQHYQYQNYVVDSSGNSSSGDSAPHAASYNPTPMYTVEYNPAATGMVNAAMRDYDLAWLSNYRPPR